MTDLAGLLDRYGLSPVQIPRFQALLELLAADPRAPTAVRDRQAILEDHFADSLVALELDEVRTARRVADLGAGAGLPGLVLALALPHAHVALVESARRKCEFIGRAIDAAAAGNARKVHARVEEWREGAGRNDLVTARALAPLDVVAEYAAPLLRVGGALVVWRGRREVRAELAAARAGAILGLEVRPPRAVRPYPGAVHRHLHLMFKASETPPRFPRRAGMARKRPLGGPDI
ncbi:MAG: 16S rRNA (guanine(527)-N(7))-methyltransferase RsmG [Solirubrobacteraceae bacterium]